MRLRLSNPEGFPPCVYRKHGSIWLVKGGVWTNLGKDRTQALAEYARLTSGNPAAGSFPAFCDASFEALKGDWKPNTVSTYDGIYIVYSLLICAGGCRRAVRKQG